MRIRDSLIDYRNSFTQPEKVHQVQCVVSKKWAKANAWNMSTKKKKKSSTCNMFPQHRPSFQLLEASELPD